MIEKIPEKLLSLAEANYFCNVCEFIGIGENRAIDMLQGGRIKRDFEKASDWFLSLDDAGKARVVRFLEAEWEKVEVSRRFFQSFALKI